jgi:hypothetical protein
MAVKEVKRRFVSKSNSSLCVDRCCMTSVKLILNIGLTIPLRGSFVGIPGYPLLGRLSSN